MKTAIINIHQIFEGCCYALYRMWIIQNIYATCLEHTQRRDHKSFTRPLSWNSKKLGLTMNYSDTAPVTEITDQIHLLSLLSTHFHPGYIFHPLCNFL